jgi:VanZ family protein
MTRLRSVGARSTCAALLALWCATSFWLSSQNDPEESVGVRLRLNDKVEHGVEYATGGFLAAGAFGFLRGRRGFAAAVAFCGLWGASDEWHQSFVPGRDSSVFDLAADVAGCTIGALAWTWAAGPADSRRASVDESEQTTDRAGRT